MTNNQVPNSFRQKRSCCENATWGVQAKKRVCVMRKMRSPPKAVCWFAWLTYNEKYIKSPNNVFVLGLYMWMDEIITPDKKWHLTWSALGRYTTAPLIIRQINFVGAVLLTRPNRCAMSLSRPLLVLTCAPSFNSLSQVDAKNAQDKKLLPVYVTLCLTSSRVQLLRAAKVGPSRLLYIGPQVLALRIFTRVRCSRVIAALGPKGLRLRARCADASQRNTLPNPSADHSDRTLLLFIQAPSFSMSKNCNRVVLF
jgi:hypothetical protein